jgi:acetyl esterase/lipase
VRILILLLVAVLVALALLVVGLTLSDGAVRTSVPERPNAFPLYPEGAPTLHGGVDSENWVRVPQWDGLLAYNVTRPTLEPFLPEPATATGAAVVILPGGASVALGMNQEGWNVARWFAEHGVAAFVLKYRTRPSPTNPFVRTLWSLAQMPGLWKDGKFVLPPFEPAVDDGLAAIRQLRARAEDYGIDAQRIGMIGFSAGAITTLAVLQRADAPARPAFAGLLYGPLDTATPPNDPSPLFVAIAADDPFAQKTDNGLVPAWKKAGAPVAFHLYPFGGHGFGLGRDGTDTVQWPEQFIAWLHANQLLTPAVGEAGSRPEIKIP